MIPIIEEIKKASPLFMGEFDVFGNNIEEYKIGVKYLRMFSIPKNCGDDERIYIYNEARRTMANDVLGDLRQDILRLRDSIITENTIDSVGIIDKMLDELSIEERHE